MALKIQTQLDDEQELMFNQIVDNSDGNKTFVKAEFIKHSLKHFYKLRCKPSKMHKPSEILARLNTDENE